ncbi:cell division control protein [Hanseniaspora vineae]
MSSTTAPTHVPAGQTATTPIEPKGYVGFDTITSQIEHRLLKKGFQFNIMVVGHSGLGKSTLVNTLFSADLIDRENPSLDHLPKTTEIKLYSRVLVEDKVQLKINLIDTPGFGDQINNNKAWEPIIKYIKEQYSQYLRKELTAQREKRIEDTRVHALLYFIEPHATKGLTELDIAVLKKLSDIVNVIPVIAKADSLTLNERNTFRSRIQQEFSALGLKLYPFDDHYDDLTEDELELNSKIRSIIPFAIVGSNQTYTNKEGKLVRGRKTRAGDIIEVENSSHCEFVYLREFLVRTHLQDLIESTALMHYETFRAKQLIALKENASNNRQSQSGALQR